MKGKPGQNDARIIADSRPVVGTPHPPFPGASGPHETIPPSMKVRKEAGVLKAKAVSSLRRATVAFNSYEDDGRVTSVLLHLQHGFEMLLKAALVQRKVEVFDRKLGGPSGSRSA